MKSGRKAELSEDWWERERPEGLDKTGDKFARALKDFQTAHDALNLTADREQLTRAELTRLTKCLLYLKRLEKIAPAVIVECKARLKRAADREARTDLENTIDALTRPLAKAIAAKRKEYDSYDGDGGSGVVVSPEAHAAYLKQMTPKVKRAKHFFAFALVGREATAQRMLFHKRKAGKSLAMRLRKDTRARAVTWGIAAGAGGAGAGLGGMTLLLVIEGRMIPSLGRRVRLLLKGLGVSAFNKVVVARDGKIAEKSDDSQDKPKAAKRVARAAAAAAD